MRTHLYRNRNLEAFFMKLSMWMIANRLSSLLEMDTRISLDAQPILNSARLAYATNCVHLYEEKGCVICDGEGDTLRIRGLSLKEAFEIVQGVFDYFQDWESQIQENIRIGNYQAMIDSCDILFQNPMLLMNANNQVLAMSSSYGPDDVDEEWNYLARYGYSSPESVRQMKQNPAIDIDRFGYQQYLYTEIPGLRYGGISYNLQFNQLSCGRINVLSKNRPLNPGDYQLLVKMALLLEPALSKQSEDDLPGYNALYNLIFNRSYSPQEVDLQMDYYQWKKDDFFQIAVLDPGVSETSTDLTLLANTLQKLISRSIVFNKDAQIVLLSNQELDRNQKLLDFCQQLSAKFRIRLGFSLFLNDYRQAASLYRQATHALSYADKYKPGQKICPFYEFAIYYIMDNPFVAERSYACHPVIRTLWKNKQQNQDVLYDTLKQYLDHERSLVKTAEALYTHRNTVLYRLKKIFALLNDNLDNAAHRYYIRLSMQCLEMIEYPTHF